MEKIVNEIATLKAQIAELSKDLKAKESVLKAIGSGTYEGSEHYIVISEATRKTLDMKAVRAKLSVSFRRIRMRLITLQLRFMGTAKR